MIDPEEFRAMAIRAILNSGKTQKKFASDHGVSVKHIEHVLAGDVLPNEDFAKSLGYTRKIVYLKRVP